MRPANDDSIGADIQAGVAGLGSLEKSIGTSLEISGQEQGNKALQSAGDAMVGGGNSIHGDIAKANLAAWFQNMDPATKLVLLVLAFLLARKLLK
jgi:hypothetical protein